MSSEYSNDLKIQKTFYNIDKYFNLIFFQKFIFFSVKSGGVAVGLLQLARI